MLILSYLFSLQELLSNETNLSGSHNLEKETLIVNYFLYPRFKV